MSTVASPLTFEPIEHVYRLNGVVVPSVTQVLRHTRYVRLVEDIVEKAERQEITWVESLSQMQQRLRILEVARDRGQRVHTALHYLHENDLDAESIDEEVRGYLRSAQAYLDAHVTRVLLAEVRVWSTRHIYAGTLDILAEHRMDGRLFIGDFKTGQMDAVATDLQTSAYLGALLEMSTDSPELQEIVRSRGPVIHRRGIRLFKDGRVAKETTYPDPRDFTRFLNALAVVHDQQRRPLPVINWDDER